MRFLAFRKRLIDIRKKEQQRYFSVAAPLFSSRKTHLRVLHMTRPAFAVKRTRAGRGAEAALLPSTLLLYFRVHLISKAL